MWSKMCTDKWTGRWICWSYTVKKNQLPLRQNQRDKCSSAFMQSSMPVRVLRHPGRSKTVSNWTPVLLLNMSRLHPRSFFSSKLESGELEYFLFLQLNSPADESHSLHLAGHYGLCLTQREMFVSHDWGS